MKAARVDSLAIAAGGLQAKGRVSFKTGVFRAIEPPKAARRALWVGQAPVIIAARHRLCRESAPGAAPCSTVPS